MALPVCPEGWSQSVWRNAQNDCKSSRRGSSSSSSSDTLPSSSLSVSPSSATPSSMVLMLPDTHPSAFSSSLANAMPWWRGRSFAYPLTAVVHIKYAIKLYDVETRHNFLATSLSLALPFGIVPRKLLMRGVEMDWLGSPFSLTIQRHQTDDGNSGLKFPLGPIYSKTNTLTPISPIQQAHKCRITPPFSPWQQTLLRPFNTLYHDLILQKWEPC
jgi:hypothetical protein